MSSSLSGLLHLKTARITSSDPLYSIEVLGSLKGEQRGTGTRCKVENSSLIIAHSIIVWQDFRSSCTRTTEPNHSMQQTQAHFGGRTPPLRCRLRSAHPLGPHYAGQGERCKESPVYQFSIPLQLGTEADTDKASLRDYISQQRNILKTNDP